MIKSFSVFNYYSIYEQQNISFEICKKDMLDESSFRSDCGNNLNSIITMIGNNASGKTNVLRGLYFLLWFSQFSYQQLSINDLIPIEAHKLYSHENTKFELIFENQGKEYCYKLELNQLQVVYEYLGVKVQRGYSNIYEIERKEKVIYKQWKLSSLNSGDKERFEQRKNTSLFSFLLNTGHLPTIGLNNVIHLYGNIRRYGRCFENLEQQKSHLLNDFDENPNRKDDVLKYIKTLGLGISDFSLMNSSNGRDLFIRHKYKENEFDINFSNESNGTQSVIYLLNSIIPVLKKGGILIYDEIENSIHPYIIKKLITLLSNKETNSKHAQILFSTHQPWLLDDRTKTQIYLVEKNEQLSTEIYRLDDVEGVRNDDNFCNKYLAGAYGAVSDMRWF